MSKHLLIIGSGVAGAAIANTVLKRTPSAIITILEAGGKIKLKDFSHFQNYLITNKLSYDDRYIYDAFADLPYGEKEREGENSFRGNTNVPLAGSRLFMYGGSSTHWGGWAFRLKEEDFRLEENRRKHQGKIMDSDGIIDWPLSYQELIPFYEEAETFLGVSGTSERFPHFPFTREDGLVINALDQLDISFTHLPIARNGVPIPAAEGVPNSGHTPCQTTGTCKYCPFGARFAAANFLDGLKLGNPYPHLRIICNVVVKEILLKSGTVASGVTFFNRLTNREEVLQADEIIVAAGAIESTKLLMRSGVRDFWPNGLGNRHDQLGRYFVTHPYFGFRARIPLTDRKYRAQMGFPTLVSRHFDTVNQQMHGKFVLLHPYTSPSFNLAGELIKGQTGDQIIKTMQQNVWFKLEGMIEIFTRFRNRISLLPTQNRFGLPQTAIDFSADKGFEARMIDIEKEIKQIFKYMGAVDVTPDKLSWRADHAACTTRMSEDVRFGVVNRDLLVHGMQNVYVCSNSSFSSIGAVNPTLTLTALAIRLGEHLNEHRLTKLSHE